MKRTRYYANIYRGHQTVDQDGYVDGMTQDPWLHSTGPQWMDPVSMEHPSKEVWGISTSNSPSAPFLHNHALYITHTLTIHGYGELPSHVCLLFLQIRR